MLVLRAGIRLVAVVLCTATAFAVWALTRPVGLVSVTAAARSQRFWTRTWARGVARIIGLRVTVKGTPPSAPFFLVSNHLSYVDIIVLLTQVEGLFLAKSEIGKWPLLGLIIRNVGTVFVDQTRRSDLPRAIEEVQRVLALDHGVMIFPEGGNQKGDKVYPFKSSVFEVPLRAACPVYCVSLSYRTPAGAPPAHQAVCWWTDVPFLVHVFNLLQLRHFEALVCFIEEPVAAQDRKDLARKAQEAVEAEFLPVVAASSVGALQPY